MWKAAKYICSHSRLWLLLVLYTISLFSTLLLETMGTSSPLYATNTHGCAPSTPPPLPGSPTPGPPSVGILVINEVLTAPASIWNCSDSSGTASFDREAWIELYNPQSQAFNLYGDQAMFSLNNGTKTYEYPLPVGAMISAHGFLVLFPSSWTTTQLTGEQIQFLISGVIIDQVTLPVLALDQSYARMPDGGNSWQLVDTPTINASNISNVLATPTPPKPTPTHTSTRRSKKRSHPSSGRSNSNNGNSSSSESGGTDEIPPPSDGTQPGWLHLQLPTASPTATLLRSEASTLPQRSTSNGGIDSFHIILITIFGTLLATVVLCGRRIFKSP